MPPGTFNPVSAVASTSNVPQSKSFRSRLGFGGSNGGSGLSTKPSFFSQLKPGRKSLGGLTDTTRSLEDPILVIDAESEHQRAQQIVDNCVVLNEEIELGGPSQSPTRPIIRSSLKPYLSSPPSSPPKHISSHSPLTRPVNTSTGVRLPNPELPPMATEVQLNPDESGISKHLPDISTDISLLVNEPPPDTMSQSDFHKSEASRSDGTEVNSTSLKGKGDVFLLLPRSSPATPETHDSSRPWNSHESAPAFRSVASSPPVSRQNVMELSESAVSGPTNNAVENISASFDLSSAKLSLDLVRKDIGEEWGKTLVIEGSGDTSDLLAPPGQTVSESASGPVTSTPCLSPTKLSSQPQAEVDISFDLDALDPDLVALLRPNTYKHGPAPANRVVTPSPLELFPPPPDPLNPNATSNLPSNSSSFSPLPPSPRYMRDEADVPVPSSRHKYATLSSSTSPAKPLSLPQLSYTTQDVIPSSRTIETSLIDARFNLPRLQTPLHDPARYGPSPTTTSSETGTPSDASKQPSPLSVPPLTLDDLERTREAGSSQWSGGTMSMSTSRNITMRRYVHAAQFQSPRPDSALTSSTDSRPAPRYALRERDREPRPASAFAAPNSAGPSTSTFGSLGRDRDHGRPPVDNLFPAHLNPEENTGPLNSLGNVRPETNANDIYSRPRERKWEGTAERRHRKRSMSLDHSGGFERGAGEQFRRTGLGPRLRPRGARDRLADSPGYAGSEIGSEARRNWTASYDVRERDREQYGYETRYGERERYGRPHMDWLGPRTAKAFAAAGLLDEPHEISNHRYGAFTRSASERNFRNAGMGGMHERMSPGNGGFRLMDGERDRGNFRYNPISSVRSGSDRESYSRTGTESPSVMSGTRPPSRGESWSHGRPGPLFTRTMSDLISQRGSTDGRESISGVHPHTGSAYSGGVGGTGGGSAGSGGGRASPTTTSSLVIMQSQIQSLKDKHDSQTEALLAALADSQRTCKELREENETLKGQVRTLEERLVDTIANSKQREKEVMRTMRIQQRTQVLESKRALPSRPDPEIPHLQGLQAAPKHTHRSTPSPTKRRPSTSSSVFPIVPGSMSLLMAETPGSPSQGSLGSTSSRPPSPTLVVPKPANKPKLPERRNINGYQVQPSTAPQPIPKSHRRSASEVSMATSANFSFDTGSPGSLKLKPEHERLLGDMTKLSLITGFGGDSEGEG